MKKLIKKLLPESIFSRVKKIVYPTSLEYKWVRKTSKKLNGLIKKDIIITPEGNFYLRSDFGFDFIVDITDPYLRLDTFDDEKFKFLLDYLVKILPSDSVIFDVGAFRGGYSLAVSSYFPDSKIYCFEPVKKSYDKLIINVLRNKKEKQIFHYRYAVSNKNKEIIMTNDLSTGNHIITGNHFSCNHTERILAITLDSFIVENKITDVHFIKCDVEGHELLVISGAEQLINKYRPVIYMEVQKEWTTRYGYNPIDLMEKMKSYGYSVFKIGHASLEPVDDLEKAIAENENFLFISI